MSLSVANEDFSNFKGENEESCNFQKVATASQATSFDVLCDITKFIDIKQPPALLQ